MVIKSVEELFIGFFLFIGQTSSPTIICPVNFYSVIL